MRSDSVKNMSASLTRITRQVSRTFDLNTVHTYDQQRCVLSILPLWFTVCHHVFLRHFRFQKCLFVSSRLRLLQSTHMQTVTGFCRCFAFRIGKIHYHHCIVRNFQFRKFLPVYSNIFPDFSSCNLPPILL